MKNMATFSVQEIWILGIRCRGSIAGPMTWEAVCKRETAIAPTQCAVKARHPEQGKAVEAVLRQQVRQLCRCLCQRKWQHAIHAGCMLLVEHLPQPAHPLSPARFCSWKCCTERNICYIANGRVAIVLLSLPISGTSKDLSSVHQVCFTPLDKWLRAPLEGEQVRVLTRRSADAKGCTLRLLTTPTKVVAMYRAPSTFAMSCDVRLQRKIKVTQTAVQFDSTHSFCSYR